MNANRQTDRQVKAEKKKEYFWTGLIFTFSILHLRMSTTFLAFK